MLQAGTRAVRGLGGGCYRGVVLEDAWPAARSADTTVDSRGTSTVPADVPVLELDQRPAVRLLAECNLELARVRDVRGVYPRVAVRGDLPRDHDAVRRLTGENLAPLALTAVDAALVVPAAGPSLEHGLGHLGLADVMARPPAVVSVGEQRECAVHRERYGHGVPDRLVNLGAGCLVGHVSSWCVPVLAAPCGPVLPVVSCERLIRSASA